MKKLLLMIFLSTCLSGFAQDEPGCIEIEPTYLTRMPGFKIEGCQHSEYKTTEFSYSDMNDKYTSLELSGIYTWILYSKIESETRKFSGDQIRLNYANAIKKAKGESLAKNNDFFKVKANGRVVYIKIEDAQDIDEQGFSMYILEVEDMQQDVVANFDEKIDNDGKVALYGILFDVGKSDIKPESAEALAQITGYLNANPAVKIFIVGHTDNTGTFSGNMSLSKARAESIKNYLVANGKISADKLQADGVGQLCPVSTNKTEEGKRLNRRVEIVLQSIMNAILFFLLFVFVSVAAAQELPSGVTMKTFDCTYAVGQSSNYYYLSDEMIGKVEPSSCFYSETEGGRVNPLCYAEFYKTSVRDTFGTKKEAVNWLIVQMQEYYKPEVLIKWKSLLVRQPNVKLKYPWDWNYKLDKMDGIFKSKTLAENKLTLVVDDVNGHSEPMWIIRTPNTAKLTTAQVMEMTAQMNGAINFKKSPATDFIIGNKTFKASQNTFMEQMNQQHYWYADDQEIIYISCNLLKDERFKYPEVMKTILESIKW